MRFSVGHLQVGITAKGCQLPVDEKERLQRAIAAVGDSLDGLPGSALGIDVIYHPRSQAYHAEFKLSLPGRTFFTGEEDPYLDSALQRGLQELTREVLAYRKHPDREAVQAAARRAALDDRVVAPEDPDAGPLAEAVRAGDYRRFRNALAGYEEWLRKRVGRWVQRYPEAQARVGGDLLLGDVVEDVYLNAFERFTRRPTAVPLSEWLDGLIDPSLKALMRRPDEEAEAASLARTVRESGLG